jgi:hypothetical protein
MSNILISGGTGLIGNHLSNRLQEKGYTVYILSRAGTNTNKKTFSWNPQQYKIDPEAIKTADYIIHLAGANIGAKRWTRKRKKEIIDSRNQTARVLFDSCEKQGVFPKAFISASGTGYYGMQTTQKIFTETDQAASDFLGNTCKLWEQAADVFEKKGVRTAKIRTGLVLSNKGGALPLLVKITKAGLGAVIGTGKQYMPWIHINDLCNIYIKAIEDEQMKGAYNAVAPEHITNKQFMKTLSLAMNKSLFPLSIPGIIIKLLYGKMSGILLEGSRVSSLKIQEQNHQFSYKSLLQSLGDLLESQDSKE